MGFDAGAVTGALKFDTSEFAHGMAGVGAALQLFPAQLIELVENPLLGTIAIAGELAKALGEGLADAFKDVGKHALDAGLAAEKAGTSVEFFSRLTEAAKTVKVGPEELSTAFKFLQKNAVDAADGNAQAAKSFTDLGISQQFVKGHLSDNEALFTKVHEAISKLPTAAERARREMEVFGRAGANLTPLFSIDSGKLKELGDTAARFGVVETEQSAEMGRKWQIASVQIGQAWEGLKRKMAEPILDFFTNNWTKIEPVLEKVADVIGKLIPVALELLKQAIVAIIPLVDMMLAGLEGVAKVTDAFHVTTGAADAVASGRQALGDIRVELNNLHFNIDAKDAHKQIADKLQKPIQDALGHYTNARLEAISQRSKVARGIGGRTYHGMGY